MNGPVAAFWQVFRGTFRSNPLTVMHFCCHHWRNRWWKYNLLCNCFVQFFRYNFSFLQPYSAWSLLFRIAWNTFVILYAQIFLRYWGLCPILYEPFTCHMSQCHHCIVLNNSPILVHATVIQATIRSTMVYVSHPVTFPTTYEGGQLADSSSNFWWYKGQNPWLWDKTMLSHRGFWHRNSTLPSASLSPCAKTT